MATYWKSQPKKFCEFCKCWITDNKPSVDFHEKGKRHQENVKKKIEEVRKKSTEEAKKKEEENDYFKQMEKAALAAFKKDLESNSELAAHYKAKIKEKKEKAEKAQEKEESSKNVVYGPEPQPSVPSEGEWYEAVSPEGYPYYWNTVTLESIWVAPPKYVSLVEQGLQAPNESNTDGQETPSQTADDSEENNSSSDDSEENNSSADDSAEDANQESSKESNGESKVEDIPLPPGLEDIPLPRDVTLQDELESSESEEEEIAPKQDRAGRATYGQWNVIQKPEHVDLELPQQPETYETVLIPNLTAEPRVKFKEKRVSTLDSGKGETVTFKKRKLGSGARNVRRRDSDD